MFRRKKENPLLTSTSKVIRDGRDASGSDVNAGYERSGGRGSLRSRRGPLYCVWPISSGPASARSEPERDEAEAAGQSLPNFAGAARETGRSGDARGIAHAVVAGGNARQLRRERQHDGK